MARHRTLTAALSMVMLFGTAGCSCGPDLPPDLEKAFYAMKSTCSARHLSRSMYSAAFPDGKPSQFVSYLFSDMGVAEWPPLGGGENPLEDEMVPSLTGEVGASTGPGIYPRAPDADGGPQVVIAFDDAAGEVIFEAYIDPTKKPARRETCKLPKVEPAAGVADMYRNNAGMGMSDQGF